MRIIYASIADGLSADAEAAVFRKISRDSGSESADAVFLAKATGKLDPDDDRIQVLDMLPRSDEVWLYGPDEAFARELRCAKLCDKPIRKCNPERLARGHAAPQSGPAQEDSALARLGSLMAKRGACIRAIPLKTRVIVELRHAGEYSDGKIAFLPEYGREMLVIERVPDNAGRFLLETGTGTGATVRFPGREHYDTLSETLEALARDDTSGSAVDAEWGYMERFAAELGRRLEKLEETT